MGSFQDAVIREVTERDRNRQFTELAVVVSAIQEVADILLGISLPPSVEPKARAQMHEDLRARFAHLRQLYEDELYEDRYLPAYQAEVTRRERAARMAAIDSDKRWREARAKVAKLSDDA